MPDHPFWFAGTGQGAEVHIVNLTGAASWPNSVQSLCGQSLRPSWMARIRRGADEQVCLACRGKVDEFDGMILDITPQAGIEAEMICPKSFRP